MIQVPLDVNVCVHCHQRRAEPNFENSLALAHPDKNFTSRSLTFEGLFCESTGDLMGALKQAGVWL